MAYQVNKPRVSEFRMRLARRYNTGRRQKLDRQGLLRPGPRGGAVQGCIHLADPWSITYILSNP